MGPMIQTTEAMIQMVIIVSFSPISRFQNVVFTNYLLSCFSAENNPLNDYPDEISEEDEDEEVDGEASDNESGEESVSDGSTESEHLELNILSEDEELFYEDDDDDYEEGEGDDFVCDNDHDDRGF